jgi:hypothetical protein
MYTLSQILSGTRHWGVTDKTMYLIFMPLRRLERRQPTFTQLHYTDASSSTRIALAFARPTRIGVIGLTPLS